MRIAYFDCFAGAGGDMIVAAMLDAGLDTEFLKAQLKTLKIKNLVIKVIHTKRAGLKAISFKPVTPKQKSHRNLRQITQIINKSKITKKAKETAISIFDKIAKAEASVHGKEPDEIHFHEVGALDSIVDIVSASIGLEALKVQKIYCSPLNIGGGTVKCTHSLMPVPAPATAELLKNIPIVGGPIQVELLTPTAAAILATIVDRFCPLPEMKIQTVGYGAGSLKSDQFPNVLRLFLGQTTTSDTADTDSVCIIQSNIDDVTGEVIGFTTEKLLQSGALDVFTTPIYMKHGRPAVQLSIICKIEDTQKLERILFENALTFGIRKQISQRTKLTRSLTTVKTKFGRIRIKTGSLNGKILNVKPEFSDCASAAQKHNVPVDIVLDTALNAYKAPHQENDR